MVKAELGFFQLRFEGVFGDAIEFLQPALCVAPERFYAINMAMLGGEFVFAMVHSEMHVEA